MFLREVSELGFLGWEDYSKGSSLVVAFNCPCPEIHGVALLVIPQLNN